MERTAFQKSGTRDWSFDKVTARRCNHDGPRHSKRVQSIGGCETVAFQPCIPKGMSPGFGATVKQGCPGAVFVPFHDAKTAFVDVVNEKTGDVEKRRFTTRIDTICFAVYGKRIEFTRCNRGQSVRDSRNEKVRLTLRQAESELHRMLGRNNGRLAYAHLTAGLEPASKSA